MKDSGVRDTLSIPWVGHAPSNTAEDGKVMMDTKTKQTMQLIEKQSNDREEDTLQESTVEKIVRHYGQGARRTYVL